VEGLKEMKAKLPVGHCATLACVLEATARKPGNVHPQASFSDVSYPDFVACAIAIGPIMQTAQMFGVGPTIGACMSRCRELTQANTNLGIVLLLAPLAAVAANRPLDEGVRDVLGRLTMSDARAVYAAIRLARPGGLGRVAEQDVSRAPTMDLVSAMRLAADRDLVARQYANGFREVFADGVPSLLAAQAAGLNWEEALIRCHLELMARHPDTLIARKLGWDEAQEAARRAAAVLAAGWPETEESHRLCFKLDDWLRADGNCRNPGTTADLVTASLFVALREGKMTF
jgi:triphosphoribosyl-dephospho-CoA synthase